MRLIAIALLGLATLVPTLAPAQEPPARVGRLAYVQGEVAVYQDPEIGWDQAAVNMPLTSENSVWTEPGAHAEARLSGVALRFAGQTQVDIARIDDSRFDAYLVQGSIALRVRHHDARQGLHVSTPQGQLAFLGDGRYRIDVDPARDETLLTVFSGSASLRAADGDVRVGAGDAIRIYGGADPSYDREPARGSALDRWAEERDATWVERVSTRYVSPEMTGYEDLDRYGEWIDDPGYGALWYPTQVSADWVPYRDGHWAWVRPWGWTWISAEPWGYAPFHYGRWVQVRDRWCWTPGQRNDRPVWAPALVAWIGGSNFSVNAGSRAAPAVGWYPLAPWERYQPWYRASPAYVSRMNVVVRKEPPREWRDNRRDVDWRTYNRERATTVVSRDLLGQRRNLAENVLRINREQLRQAPTVSPATVVTREQYVQRRDQRRDNTPQRAGPPPAVSQPLAPLGGQARPAAPAASRDAGRDNRPRFERERDAKQPLPAPVAVPGQRPVPPPQPSQPIAPQGQPAPQSQPGAAPGRPSRDDRNRGDGPRGQEQQRQEQQRQEQQRAAEQTRATEQQRAQQEQRQQAEQQRQQQERATREGQQRQQQEQQQRAQQEQRQQAEQQRQQQERAAREGQQRQQQEQQQRAQQQAEQQRQQQQQQAQQRAAQERAAREAQQRQQQEQQRAQQQAEQQRQQQQQQLQRQQQQLQQQQQAQQRAAEAQRQAQERAAREAQQRAQPQPPPQAQPQPQPQPQRPQPQAQPQPQGQPQPAPERREDRGRGRDDDNPGKGRDR